MNVLGFYLSCGDIDAAKSIVGSLSTKLNDGAVSNIPIGAFHSIAWLVTANSDLELATKLAEVCAILPLPEWVPPYADRSRLTLEVIPTVLSLIIYHLR